MMIRQAISISIITIATLLLLFNAPLDNMTAWQALTMTVPWLALWLVACMIALWVVSEEW